MQNLPSNQFCSICSQPRGLRPKYCSKKCSRKAANRKLFQRSSRDSNWKMVTALARLNSKLKIFQNRDCIRCGDYFETLRTDRLYCTSCQIARSAETGDVKSRCLKYGHQYDSKVTLQRVRIRDLEICKLCNSEILPNSKWAERATIDHVIPLSNPASPGHVWHNVQLAHRSCNSQKGTKLIVDTNPKL
jgi:5-methylcytosine-specific restriction endonuclease McrA